MLVLEDKRIELEQSGEKLVLVVGTLGAGSVIVESVIGVLLVAVGIWGFVKSKKR